MILNKATGALVAKKNVNGLVARQFFHEVLMFFYYVCYYQIIFQILHLFCHCTNTNNTDDFI